MKQLEGIRATGTQKLSTSASNGDIIKISLAFNPSTQKWKIGIECNNFSLKGSCVFSSPNMLSQYENIIPFGLAVITEGGGDPFLVNDFSTGRVKIYTLSPEEVAEVQAYYVSIRDAG